MSYNVPNYTQQGSTKSVFGGEAEVSGLLDLTTGSTATLRGSAKVTGTVLIQSAGKLREHRELVASTITSTAAYAGWSALASHGISELSATGSTGKASAMGFLLAHPGVAGVRKIISAARCSTAKPATVECTTGQWIGSATGSTGKTNHRLVFNDAHELVELISASSVHWLLLSNQGSVALTTNKST